MTDQRLAQAWPHIRAAVEIFLYGKELAPQTEQHVPNLDIPLPGTDRREALVRQIRSLMEETEPIEPSHRADVTVSGGAKWGTWSRIARELGVTPQHVRHVALGRSTSKRIVEALARHGVTVVRKAEIGDVA